MLGRIASNTLLRSPQSGSKMFSTCGPSHRSPASFSGYVGVASLAVAVSMAGADTAKCDNAAASPQLSSHFQGHRTTDTPYKVISLQGLDLNEVSNDTAERLIDALNEGAQFDKESLVILMSMRRRLSSATAEWLIAAVNSGASLDKESLIKLVRLQLSSRSLGSQDTARS